MPAVQVVAGAQRGRRLASPSSTPPPRGRRRRRGPRRPARRRWPRPGRGCARRCRRRRPAGRRPGTPPAARPNCSRPSTYDAVRSRAPATTPAAVRQSPAIASSRSSRAHARHRSGVEQARRGRRRAPRCASGSPLDEPDGSSVTPGPAGSTSATTARAVARSRARAAAAAPSAYGHADLAAGRTPCRRRERRRRLHGDAAPGLAQRRAEQRPAVGDAGQQRRLLGVACRAAARVSAPQQSVSHTGRCTPRAAGLAQQHGHLGEAEALAAVRLGHRQRQQTRRGERRPVRVERRRWRGRAPRRPRARDRLGRLGHRRRCSRPEPRCLLPSRGRMPPNCNLFYSRPDPAGEREDRMTLPSPREVLRRQVYMPWARIPTGRMVELPGRGLDVRHRHPGPDPGRADDRAAARGGLHRPAHLVPRDPAAVAALPRGHHGPALARTRHPVPRSSRSTTAPTTWPR